MRKKLSIFLILIVCIASGIYFFSSKKSGRHFPPSYCAFCDPKVLAYQTFYEDDLVLALYTHKPMFPGHCLIIPKRHVERFEELSTEEITQMGQVIKKVNLAVMKVFETVSYLLIQKNGREAGQTVPHVHFHYVPRKAGDDSALKFIMQMYLANATGPISATEMQEVTDKLKEAME